MRITIGLVTLLVAAGVHAAKLPPPMKLNLVTASCNALPPAVPGPCSASFTFTGGQVVMKSQKQPGPTCPKTDQPTETPGGSIVLKGVTKNGARFNGSLPAQAALKTTFGSDPNGNCELRGTQVPNLTSLQGTLTCKNGTCKGIVYPIACLPKQCADTPVVSELGSVEVNGASFGPFLVLDDAGNPLATPGTFLAPSREP
jgi:hypothetical protein